MKTKLLATAALGLLVAACGTNPTDRTTGGAAAGAATGATVGALGGPVGVLGGAAVGAGVGAVAGATTTPDQVNLGRPVWNDPEVRVPGVSNRGGSSSASRSSGGGSSMAASSGNTREIQQALSQRGYDVGQVDGVYGPQTRRAISQFQRDNNMNVTGRPNSQLASALNVSDTATGSQAGNDRNRAYMGGGMVGDGNRGTTATGSGSTMGNTGSGSAGNTMTHGGMQNDGRGVVAPSNNPMNDPVGGRGSNSSPGRNNNQN